MAATRKTRRRKGSTGTLGAPPHTPPVLDWTVTTAWTVNGRNVTPGTELSFRGVRGRFRFLKHVSRPNGAEWVDVVGDTGFYSFRPSRLRTVHRIRKTRASAPIV